MSRSDLDEVELATADASLPAMVALADALGADLSVRLYPNTGPRVRDHIQAAIVEELVRLAHPRWRRLIEVPVFRPARGRIDLVLLDARPPPIAAATEVHSRLGRLEQLLGWANLKAQSLPSAAVWGSEPVEPAIGRLLVLRATRTNRETVLRFEETIRAAYPALAAPTHAALVGDVPWPGSGLLWAEVERSGVRILDRPHAA